MMSDNGAIVVGRWTEEHRYSEDLPPRSSDDDKMRAAWKMLTDHPELEKVRVYGPWCGNMKDDCDWYDRRGFYLTPDGDMAYSWRYVRNVDCADLNANKEPSFLYEIRVPLAVIALCILLAACLAAIF
jgi:hypothetical protein